MKNFAKNTLSFLLILAMIFLVASCSGLGGSSESEYVAPTTVPIVDGTLSVAIELGLSANKTAVRSAMPSGFDENFVYAATIFHSASYEALKVCEYSYDSATNKATLKIPFAISETARESHALNICAFPAGTNLDSFASVADAISNSVLHGTTTISTAANSPVATLGDSVVKLLPKSGNGTVELNITLPSADYTLSCSDTTNFTITGTSPNYALKNAGAGIAAGSYPVTLKVSKGSDVVYTRNETINVFPAMKSDVWFFGDGTSNATLSITASEIASTFYVSGSGSTWFSDFGSSIIGNDTTGDGSIGKPFATIQKAIERIKSITTAATDSYTIYVDGTITASGSTPVADFTGITSGCSITLKGLNATNKATLDGNNTARVIVAGTNAASLNLNLTLENLTITKGKYGGRGGGISICSTGGNTYKIQNCKIINCAADYGAGIYHEKGRLSFTNCEISGNNASNYSGGGVYSGGSANAAVTFANTKIESNTAQNGGGIFIGGGSKATISDGTVTIKSNVATRDSSSGSGGQGICVWEGILELKGGAKIDSSNNIRLMSGASDTAPHLKITGTLTETGTVATIWPRSYTSGTVVLEADDAAFITANYSKFTLSDTSTYEICPDSATPTQAILAKPLITIATAADFTTELNSNPNANIKLAADIDISGNSTLCTTTPFNGTIDGNGHTITISADNQFADANSGDFAVCIFGKIGSDGVIKNLTVSSSDIAVGSGAAFGGICKDNNGTIENCTNNINFSSSESTRDVGGICINNNGTIKNCTNNGNLALTTSTGWGNCPNVGGIAATNTGTIENCTNNGMLVCNQNLGPIVGRKDSGTVTGCTDNKGITVKGSGR